jgi:hypothetical protein
MEDNEHHKRRAAAYWFSQGELIRILLEDRNRSEAVEVSCSDPIAPSRSRLQICRRALASAH